eukprot:COSAG01_NODE_14705_length_1420_cov_1.285390_1_plen_139_part_10
MSAAAPHPAPLQRYRGITPPCLHGCSVLPRASGGGGGGRRRQAKGTLELHANGLRFRGGVGGGGRGDVPRLDILFDQIERAFFQPATNRADCELRDDTARLHLRLRAPLPLPLPGSRQKRSACRDVQFLCQLSDDDCVD